MRLVMKYLFSTLLLLAACNNAPPVQPPIETGTAGQLAAADVAASVGVAAAGTPAHSTTDDTLQMPALEPGFTRLIGPPVELAAGDSNDWMQWVAEPTDQDYDVSEMKGAQTGIGHHAILYTTSDANPVGTSRLWSERDQLTSQTVGGLGAEGAIPIPPGVVLRVKKGTYLVFDVHYLNPSDRPRTGATYMDIKLVPASPTSVLASRIANSSLMIQLPPHQQTKLDIPCKVERDVKLLRFTNHMHEYGTSVYTQFVDPAGQTQMIKLDARWSPDWALAPNYEFHPVEAPLLIPAGSMLSTHCEWNNTTDDMIKFPHEMCAFSGLLLGDTDITCLDGKSPMAAMPAGPSAGQAGSAGASSMAQTMGGAAGAAGAPASSTGACNSADQSLLESDDFAAQFKNCGAMCFGEDGECATACLMKNTMLSASCATCNGTKISCAMMYCVADCSSDVASTGCQGCIETNCGAAYHQCAGL